MAKKPKFLPQRRRKLSDQHYIKLKSFEEEWWSFYTAEIYDFLYSAILTHTEMRYEPMQFCR